MQGSPIGHLSYGHAVSGSLLLASHARINQLTLKVCLDPVNCLVNAMYLASRFRMEVEFLLR